MLELKISHLLKGIEKLSNIRLTENQFFNIIQDLENTIYLDFNNHEDRKIVFYYVLFRLKDDIKF